MKHFNLNNGSPHFLAFKYDTANDIWDAQKIYRVVVNEFYLIKPIGYCPDSHTVRYKLTDLYKSKPAVSYYKMEGGNMKQKSRNNRRRTLRRTRRS